MENNLDEKVGEVEEIDTGKKLERMEEGFRSLSRIGKFDSPESLLKGYEELEKEFTKRCQKLKELEREHSTLSESIKERSFKESVAGEVLSDEEYLTNFLADGKIRQRVIEEYLTSLMKGAPIIGANNGMPPLAPLRKPRTLSEAKNLADTMMV